MALFGHDRYRDDRDDRYRGRWERGFMGYDREHRGPGVWTLNEPGWGTAAYDAGYQMEHHRQSGDYGMGHRGSSMRGYDPGYRMGRGMGGEYGADFGRRWQRDYGDPFGDREARTPMRMLRGGYRGSGRREYGWEGDYDRGYAANPMGYEPYYHPRDVYDRSGGRGPGYGRRYGF